MEEISLVSPFGSRHYKEIVIEAAVISKKNSYAQTKTGRRFKPQSVVDAEKLAMMQIPAEFYGLELRHPDMEFFAWVPKKSMSSDVDGLFTTILDYLVKASVIHDDCIRHFNGTKVIHPVQEAERKKFVIRLYPKEND